MSARAKRTGAAPDARRRLRPVSVIDAVSASVRERVVSGEFPAGTHLREIELAEEYTVARPTVRAALQQLTLTGLLHREANRGAYVPELSPDEIADLFSTRTLIETEIVRRLTKAAGRSGANATTQPAQVVAHLERFTDEDSWSEVVEADLAFHRSLAEATESPWLLRLFELLEDAIRLAIAQLKPAYASPSELAREHRLLLTTIGSGKTKQAMTLMQQHLDQAVHDLTKTP